MAEVVPFMQEIGIRVPAHLDHEQGTYLIDCPFPARFDEERREWLLDEGPVSWEEVLVRWRRRGPMNRDYVRTLQRGYQTTSLRRGSRSEEHTSELQSRQYLVCRLL